MANCLTATPLYTGPQRILARSALYWALFPHTAPNTSLQSHLKRAYTTDRSCTDPGHMSVPVRPDRSDHQIQDVRLNRKHAVPNRRITPDELFAGHCKRTPNRRRFSSRICRHPAACRCDNDSRRSYRSVCLKRRSPDYSSCLLSLTSCLVMYRYLLRLVRRVAVHIVQHRGRRRHRCRSRPPRLLSTLLRISQAGTDSLSDAVAAALLRSPRAGGMPLATCP